MSIARHLVFCAVVLGAPAAGCQSRRSEPAPAPNPAAAPAPESATTPGLVLVAKRGTPLVNGELAQPVWHAAASTAPFVNVRGRQPVAHTDASASWDEQALHVAFYVADDDFRASDRVRLQFGEGELVDASPDGRLKCQFRGVSDCAALGIQAGFDVDGDVDAEAREDEEWAVTIAVPWRALAPDGRPGELAVTLRRDERESRPPLHEIWGGRPGIIRLE